MKGSISLLLATSLAACAASDDDRQRYVDPAKSFEVVQPDAWRSTMVRGSAEFRRSDPHHGRHTIIVRTAERPREITEGKPTTRDDVVEATTRVLKALPKAKLDKTQPVAGADLSATRFSLTFEPRNAKGRYRREHAVLVGNKHVFHVIYTAPIGESIDEQAFNTMISTLTEGV